jgi:tetratricopeptide (TPR) repeat protein
MYVRLIAAAPPATAALLERPRAAGASPHRTDCDRLWPTVCHANRADDIARRADRCRRVSRARTRVQAQRHEQECRAPENEFPPQAYRRLQLWADQQKSEIRQLPAVDISVCYALAGAGVRVTHHLRATFMAFATARPFASLVAATSVLIAAALPLPAQSARNFPPDSLINTEVISRATPVIQVIGMMRNFSGNLGVRCSYCHEGREDQELTQYDFAANTKRPKRVAIQMMRMVEEINRRLDTLPERTAQGLRVTCATCHRGVARPIPLSALVTDVAQTSGSDSALTAYRNLRQRYYGSDAYDFSEPSLNIAAFRLARAGKFEEALRILKVNAEQFPTSSAMEVFRGNIQLMRGDTTAAATAFREAIRRDPRNDEAAGRLKTIGRSPR